MDQCSQALNRGAQPMPSAQNTLSIPALSLDSRDAGICAPAPAYQIHTDRRLPFVRFAWKTASSVRKAFSSVRLCPFRAMDKLKTNSLWERLYADCPSKERAPLKIARISKPTPPPSDAIYILYLYTGEFSGVFRGFSGALGWMTAGCWRSRRDAKPPGGSRRLTRPSAGQAL